MGHPDDALNQECRICREHLKKRSCGAHQGRTDPFHKGVVRLRSCGCEFHQQCWVNFVRSQTALRLPRKQCPQCGDIWACWGWTSTQSGSTKQGHGAEYTSRRSCGEIGPAAAYLGRCV